jgi:hypothetical protein
VSLLDSARIVVVTTAAGLLLGGAAHAQTPAPVPADAVAVYGAVAGDAGLDATTSTEVATGQNKGKRGEFVIAPIPIVNPTIENGLALVGGYLYRIDKDDEKTPPSLTGVGGFKTTNGSWAASALQTLHLAHGLIRIRGAAAYGDVTYAFYGIGQSAGNAGVSIELNQVGPVGVAEGLVRVFPGWYFGARYQILDMRLSTASVSIPDGPTIPPADAHLRTAALGPRFEYDSRDTVFYPRTGMQLQGIASFYGKDVGGERSYQTYELWWNRYYAIGGRHVLAWHLAACDAEGSVTFYDLCLLGKTKDLRGYPIGRYRDRAMVAAQTEWRSELWWRFGAAAFFGGGAVASHFDQLAMNDARPGGGAGLRFTLAQRNHVNLRVDYAWGKGSTAFYVGVAEAF